MYIKLGIFWMFKILPLFFEHVLLRLLCLNLDLRAFTFCDYVTFVRFQKCIKWETFTSLIINEINEIEKKNLKFSMVSW